MYEVARRNKLCTKWEYNIKIATRIKQIESCSKKKKKKQIEKKKRMLLRKKEKEKDNLPAKPSPEKFASCNIHLHCQA